MVSEAHPDAKATANNLLNQLRDDRLASFQKMALLPLGYYTYKALSVGLIGAFCVILLGTANNLLTMWLLHRPRTRRWAAPLFVGGFQLLCGAVACYDNLLDSPALWFICGAPLMAALTMGSKAVKLNVIASILVIVGVVVGEFTLLDLPFRDHPDAALWKMRLIGLFVISGFGLIAAWRSHKLSKEILTKNEELEKARAKAQFAANSKSEFLATMSHEIRTPMNGILGTAQHLIGCGLDKEQSEYSRVVLDSGHRLMDVLNAILDLSKIEAQQFELRDTELRLDRVFKDVCKEVDRAFEAHAVELSFVEIKQPTLLQGDPSRIEQVLRNLLMTMVNLAGASRVEVELQAETGSACIEFRLPNTVLLAKERAILEEPRSVLSQRPNESQRLALVMAVSKEIIKLMGASLVVHEDTKKGTLVRWFFCRTANQQASEQVMVSATNLEVSLGLSKVHDVLVVDDNAINRRVARMQLEQLGCKVSLANDGEHALEMCEQRVYSVIFMDLSMPKLGGREATRLIRSQSGPNAKTPIIAFTADAYDAELDTLAAVGMNGHLAKPFRVAALTRLLNNLEPIVTEQAS